MASRSLWIGSKTTASGDGELRPGAGAQIWPISERACYWGMNRQSRQRQPIGLTSLHSVNPYRSHARQPEKLLRLNGGAPVGLRLSSIVVAVSVCAFQLRGRWGDHVRDGKRGWCPC